MNFLTLFEFFLLAVAFYGIFNLPEASRLIVPLACFFCIFWLQKLERKMKEDEEAKNIILQYKLEKSKKSRQKEEKTEETLLAS